MSPKSKDDMKTEEVKFPQSSNVHSAIYMKDTQTLFVRFKDSKDSDTPKSAYGYKGVEEDTWKKMKRSESVGHFVRKEIISKYDTEKLW